MENRIEINGVWYVREDTINAVGADMSYFSEDFKGLVVSDIESIDGGYKLITKQR